MHPHEEYGTPAQLALTEPNHVQVQVPSYRLAELETAMDDMDALGPDFNIPTCQATYCQTGYDA